MTNLYEELLPDELNRLMKKKIVFVPFGLLEWHGLHLPLGTDGLKAYEICKRVAKKVNGIVLPPTYWGIYGVDLIKSNTLEYDGTLRVDVKTFKALVEDIFKTLIYQGFEVIVALTGHYHPEQVRILKELGGKIMKKYKDIRIVALAEYELCPNEECADHGAKWETSIMHELRPDLVKLNKLDDKLLGLESWKHPENLDPRKSSSKRLGKSTVKNIVNNLAKIVLREE